MEGKTVYFEKSGDENTEAVLRIAKERADELGIKTVVVAFSTGGTAARAVDVFAGAKVVAVGVGIGVWKPDAHESANENRKKVESKGGVLLTATHIFSGVDRAMRVKFNSVAPGEIIANVLRIFGEGMKVACEMAVMAADAGLVRTDEDIIVIAGTARGADTAVVLTPVDSNNFFDLKVKEVLCKPHF